MTKNGETSKWRIEVLEGRVNSMDNRLDKLMTNHIPHLKEEIIMLKTRINVLSVVNVSAIILGLLFVRYFGG